MAIRAARARINDCTDFVAAISGSGEISTYKTAETIKNRITSLARADTGSTIRRVMPGSKRQVAPRLLAWPHSEAHGDLLPPRRFSNNDPETAPELVLRAAPNRRRHNQ